MTKITFYETPLSNQGVNTGLHGVRKQNLRKKIEDCTL